MVDKFILDSGQMSMNLLNLGKLVFMAMTCLLNIDVFSLLNCLS